MSRRKGGDMEIRILQLIEGARAARGLTVIIDVFRAFSLEAYLFQRGVKTIFPVGSIETAYALKEQLDKENPFRVIYFPEGGQPYDMHYKVNGDFENLFGEGFFDAAAKNRVELYKMQLGLNK